MRDRGAHRPGVWGRFTAPRNEVFEIELGGLEKVAQKRS
jgi:hypothetical protein